MAYVLITDSGADLPHTYFEEHSIPFLSIRYTINGQTREDSAGKSLPYKEFYRLVREGAMPTTSMINPEDYLRVFEPILAGGTDIIYIAFSSGLSGSCASAQMAANELLEKYPESRLHVFDSRCASLGQGLLVDFARRLRDEGKTFDELCDWLRENAPKLNHFVTVDDLMHLHRGGRVSRASAMVGTLIGIKPMLYVNPEGKLLVCGKKRGRRAALDMLLEYMDQYVSSMNMDTIAISHGDCEEDASYVENLVRERYKVGHVIVNYIGSVIGSHAGPGTVALFFLGKTRKA